MIQINAGKLPGTFNVAGSDARLAPMLQPGRILEANVEQRPDGRLVARLGRLALPLPQGAQAQPGNPIRLQVSEQQGRLLLTVLSNSPDDDTDAATLALRRRDLPREQPTLAGLRPLLALRASGSPAAPALPPAVQEALTELFQRLATPESLTRPEGLRVALRDSGTLLETLLMKASPGQIELIAGRDLKAILSRAAAQLRAEAGTSPASSMAANTPGAGGPLIALLAEAGRGVEGLLARLNLLQGASLSADGRLDLAFELPVRVGDALEALELRIREEGGGDDADAERGGNGWRVDLRFRFAEGDALQARLRLYGHDSVAVTWTAEHPATAAALERALPRLTTALEAARLQVRHVSARQGVVEARHPALDSGPRGGLLHERI